MGGGGQKCSLVGNQFYTNVSGVFEVPFWNSAEYGILYGIDVFCLVQHNSAKLFTVQYRKILQNSVEFCRTPYWFMYSEFRIPSNENSSLKKTKEKYTRNGIYSGIPQRFVYAKFHIPSHVICAGSLKKQHCKELTP